MRKHISKHSTRTARRGRWFPSTALLWAGILLLALTASSCRTTIGDAQVVIRPGTRVPDRVVETVTGEYEMMEGLDPEGETVMLLMRAYW